MQTTHSFPDARQLPPLNPAALVEQAAPLGEHSLLQFDAAATPVALTGTRDVEVLAGGLLLRHAHVYNHCDMHHHARLFAGTKLVMLLAGEAHVRFGGKTLPVDSPGQAAMVNLARTDCFERRARAGTREASLTLTVPHQWLEKHFERVHEAPCDIRRLPHLSMCRWQPDALLLEQARAVLLGAADMPPAIRHLQQQSLALAMLAQALPAMLEMPEIELLEPRSARHLRCIRGLIDNDDMLGLDVEQIARRTGMSPSVLQRKFKQCHGVSLQRYLRQRRLLRARWRLERDAISVDEAATLAGYEHAANFATAFRRNFGMSPRAARKTAEPVRQAHQARQGGGM